MKELRVAAYCRVSTEHEDQANSLVSQRRYFTEYIRSHTDWELVDIYYDEGISGTQTAKREGFKRMIQDAMAGNMDLILTKEVSRFARNTVDTLYYTRKLKEYKIGVIFTIDNIDTREQDGELRLTIMASIAQEESRKTSERVKWGQKRRMEQGVVFGRELLGYGVKDGKLYINEEEARIVRAIFHKYTNEEKGTYVIARELFEEGFPSKSGLLWSNASILRILKNEKYVGDLCQKKTITPDYLTHKKKYNRGEEEKIYITDHHAPIIHRELWNRTQEALRVRKLKTGELKKYSSRYWCSGKLICGRCGRSFVSRTKTRKDGSLYKAWRCSANAGYGREKTDDLGRRSGCDNQTVSENALLSCMDFAAARVPVSWNSLKEEVLFNLQKLELAEGERTEIERLKRKREALEEKKRKAIDLVLEGMLSREDLRKQIGWYEEKIEAVNRQIQTAEKKTDIVSVNTYEVCHYRELLDEVLNIPSARESIYREILEKIIVYDHDTLAVWLKCLPVGFHMKIRTSGRGENYTTKLLEINLLKKEKKPAVL